MDVAHSQRHALAAAVVEVVGWKPRKYRGRKDREARVRYTLITWIVSRDFRESTSLARFNVTRVVSCARETRTDRKND